MLRVHSPPCNKVSFFVRRGNVTFLSPNKKVTKEVGIGKALKAALPRVPAALPYVPIPARTGLLRSILEQLLFRQKVSRLFA